MNIVSFAAPGGVEQEYYSYEVMRTRIVRVYVCEKQQANHL